jgi:hypothetical protein
MTSRGSITEMLRWADYPLSESDLPWRKPGACIDSGWLVKSGGRRTTRTSYKRRWFKIVGRTLHYYTKPDSDHPLGSVSLEGGVVGECPSPDTTKMRGFFFFFTPNAAVQKNHKRFARTFTLRALTARSRSEWMESLERCTMSVSRTVLLAAKSMGKILGGEKNDITPWGDEEEEEEEEMRRRGEEKETTRRRRQEEEAEAAALSPSKSASSNVLSLEEDTKTEDGELLGRRPRADAEGVMGEVSLLFLILDDIIIFFYL